MRKVLTLILCVLTALCIFSACAKEKKKINDSDAVRAAVCEYTELLCCGSEAAFDYVVKGTDTYDKTAEIITQVSSFDSFVQDKEISEESADEIDEYITDFTCKIMALVDCHVTDAKVEKKKATITVTVKAPKVDEIGNIINKIEEEKTVEPMLSEEEMAEYKKNGFSTKYAELILEETVKELEKTVEDTVVVFEMEKLNSDWYVSNFNKK